MEPAALNSGGGVVVGGGGEGGVVIVMLCALRPAPKHSVGRAFMKEERSRSRYSKMSCGGYWELQGAETEEVESREHRYHTNTLFLGKRAGITKNATAHSKRRRRNEWRRQQHQLGFLMYRRVLFCYRAI
jgi:hypothetical protein